MNMKFGCNIYHIILVLCSWITLNMILCHTLTKLEVLFKNPVNAVEMSIKLINVVYLCYYEENMQCFFFNNGIIELKNLKWEMSHTNKREITLVCDIVGV